MAGLFSSLNPFKKKYEPIKIGSYIVTYESMDDPNTPDELDPLLSRFHQQMKTNPTAQLAVELRQYIAKYPNVPSLKNYLFVTLIQTGKTKEADQVLNDTIRKHPAYLFSRTQKALQVMQESEMDEPESTANAIATVERLFNGPPTDISLVYPDRNVFHYSEVENFLLVCIDYELAKLNPDAAEKHRQTLKKIGYDNKPILKHLKQKIGIIRMMATFDKLKGADTDTRIEGEFRAEDTQTEEAPSFHHSEIQLLYEYGFDLPADYLRQILALSRPTLTADLNTVLTDTVNRYWYFTDSDWSQKKHSFPFHALLIAAELQADECFDAVMSLLRQGSELTEYWFSDWIEDLIQPYFMSLIPGRADDLRNFVCEPNVNSFAKAITAGAIVQYTLRNPDYRPLALNWFRDVMSFLLDQANDPALNDTDLMSSLTAHADDLKLTELLPLIEQIYAQNLASLNMMGDFKAVKKAFAEPLSVKDNLRETEPILERYKMLHAHMERVEKEEKEQLANPKKGEPDIRALLDLFAGADDDGDEDDDDGRIFPQEPIKVAYKPGRNDKVTVKYPGGKVVSDVKYKKVEADVLAGKCVLVGGV
jgi:hypothetical protein